MQGMGPTVRSCALIGISCEKKQRGKGIFNQPHHIEVSILTVFPVNQHDNNTSNDNSIDLQSK